MAEKSSHKLVEGDDGAICVNLINPTLDYVQETVIPALEKHKANIMAIDVRKLDVQTLLAIIINLSRLSSKRFILFGGPLSDNTIQKFSNISITMNTSVVRAETGLFAYPDEVELFGPERFKADAV